MPDAGCVAGERLINRFPGPVVDGDGQDLPVLSPRLEVQQYSSSKSPNPARLAQFLHYAAQGTVMWAGPEMYEYSFVGTSRASPKI